jgi:hypothetical protein
MVHGGISVMDAASEQPGSPANEGDGVSVQALVEIRASLRGLRFGSVNIIVQDGVVIQIDRTEKRRLKSNLRSRGP